MKYGQSVGFDLTFSLIKDRSSNGKEYLEGVVGAVNQARRSMVFAVVVTSCTSTEAYEFIFREFFRIMDKIFCDSAVYPMGGIPKIPFRVSAIIEIFCIIILMGFTLA